MSENSGGYLIVYPVNATDEERAHGEAIMEDIAKHLQDDTMSERDNLPDDVARVNLERDERLEEEWDEYEPETEADDEDQDH